MFIPVLDCLNRTASGWLVTVAIVGFDGGIFCCVLVPPEQADISSKHAAARNLWLTVNPFWLEAGGRSPDVQHTSSCDLCGIAGHLPLDARSASTNCRLLAPMWSEGPSCEACNNVPAKGSAPGHPLPGAGGSQSTNRLIFPTGCAAKVT